MDNGFQVKVGLFEGPFDLILTLIEERKMHVSDVSLSSIADDFVTYVRAQTAFPADQAAGFILTAATLLFLKSKALLPVFTLSEEEEGDIKDLEHRLELYKIFRMVARDLGAQKGKVFFGGLRRDLEPLFSPSADMTQKNIFAALAEALTQAPISEKRVETVVSSVVSLEEMMVRLGERIEKALSTTFKDFVGSPEDTREIIVGFLAVLELVKRGQLFAEQRGGHGDIILEHAEPLSGAPKYS